MNDALSRYLEAVTGITKVTRTKAERIVRNLAKQGEAAARNPQELVEQLLQRSQENREALSGLVRSETRKAIKAMGLATRNDVERLQRQLSDVRRAVAEEGSTRKRAAKATAGGRSGAKKAAKKTAARKTAARKAAKAPTTTPETTEGGSSTAPSS
ncbi:MAG TPA: hypothetical protein VHF25_13810 [Nitriliruptorales bacterium]|nr:hypothetical protein [Nitriliruptorales bacterium]